MNPKRSHEPVVWLMFAGGGMVTALMWPAILLAFVVLIPWELISIDLVSYERILQLSESWLGRLVWLALIIFPAWHALHRLYHLSRDVRLGNARFMSILCYGAAVVASISTFTLVIAI